MPVLSIASAADLRSARSEPRAFIFLWVAWASQARDSEVLFQAFVEAWRATHPELPVPAFLADLTEQTGEVWDEICSWLASQEPASGELTGKSYRGWSRWKRPPTARESLGILTAGGYGALLWSRSGVVVASVPYLASSSLDALMAMTESVFRPET